MSEDETVEEQEEIVVEDEVVEEEVVEELDPLQQALDRAEIAEKEISYKGEIFKVNDEEFTFLKNERENLIILLMASYNDNLLDSIISDANNKIN